MTVSLDWSWPLFFVMFVVVAIVHMPWLVRDIRRVLAETRAERKQSGASGPGDTGKPRRT